MWWYIVYLTMLCVSSWYKWRLIILQYKWMFGIENNLHWHLLEISSDVFQMIELNKINNESLLYVAFLYSRHNINQLHVQFPVKNKQNKNRYKCHNIKMKGHNELVTPRGRKVWSSHFLLTVPNYIQMRSSI